MRAGLSTIQQTLTAEAASVLNHSIAEAGRRNHGQTTPLHVAATLLAAPSGYLRQACIRSHPNSSHPLQCRALELCFSVALERLPTAQNTAMEPPISNALMAALKRAQAHQRRGCPEQQQQPLLAVKVELEQLIISILDDPSVSRVMREASFSSPAVKATIEQTLSSSSHPSHQSSHLSAFAGPRLQNNAIHAPMMPNPYINRRLMEGGAGGAGQSGGTGSRGEEVRNTLEIMKRSNKRNPVLVGDVELEPVMKEVLRKLGNEGFLKDVTVVSVEKELGGSFEMIGELGGLVESKMSGDGCLIIDLGDLKWMVEHPGGGGAKAAVAEVRKLLLGGSGEESGRRRVWLIGTASCETYMRCQVYHPTMENDWDLQALPVSPRSPIPGSMFSRPMVERISPGKTFEPLNSLKKMPVMNPALSRGITENLDPSRRLSCCPQCSEKYEQELKLATKDLESSSLENRPEPARNPLPMWMQNAKVASPDVRPTNPSQRRDLELLTKQKTNELQRKWNDTCLRLHPSFHQNVVSEKLSSPAIPAMRFCNPILMRQPMPSRLPNTRILGNSTLQPNRNETAAQPIEVVASPPRSPVRTELALGRKANEPAAAAPEKPAESGGERVKDLLSCLSSAPQTKLFEKFANALDADTFKKLLKGLMEKAWWQQDAASGVASAVTRCRLGNGKRRGAETKGDVWLLFTGPDRIAKRKMAFVLSEQMCGTNPVMVSLGSRREERDAAFRGKTALDRIVEAIRMNPFSVILLEDIDEADVIMRGNIKRAMERGRLTDSHGREISLGNVIFILTGNWSSVSNGSSADEKRYASLVAGNWQLKLTVSEKNNAKRRSSWMHDGGAERPTRKRIQQASSGLSFDLNLALGDGEDDRTDGSHNSSDLTDDDQYSLEARQFSITSVPHELVNLADDAIIFKPADLAFIRSEIKKTIATKFSMVLDDRVSIQVDEEVVERILGGLWHGRASLEEWVEKALAPSFDQLSARLPSTTIAGKSAHLQLELEPDSSLDSRDELLPSRVAVMVE